MFNPLNFGGNPAVMQLLENQNVNLDQLLEIDAFPHEFKTNNPKLIAYMDDKKYRTLINYITSIQTQANKNKAYKFPLMAAEILSTQNTQTLEYIFREGPIYTEEIIEEEIWVENDYYSSTGSNQRMEEDFDDNQENVPPLNRSRKSHPQTSFKNQQHQIKNMPQNLNNLSRSSSSSKGSITSDDFPFVQAQKRIVKVKQTQVRKVKKQLKSLLEELFSYFNQELNYTLAGYISKVLQMLLKKQPYKLRRFIFQNGWDIKIINHSNSQSISQFLVKVILSDEDFQQGRIKALNYIFEKICCDDIQEEFTSSLLFILSQILIKISITKTGMQRKLLQHLYCAQLLVKLSKNCFTAKEKKISSICSILMQYLKKTDQVIQNNSENWQKQLKHQLRNNLQAPFHDFVSQIWEKMIEKSSLAHVKILQIINYLIKEDLYWSRMQLQSQGEIAKLLISLCKKYPKNNILHCKVFELFTSIINISDSCPGLTKNAIEEKCFAVFLLEAFNHRNILYRGQCVQLCQLLKQTVSPYLLKFKSSSSKWEKIQEALHEQTERYSKSLGGHGPKKTQKYGVMFDKDKILKKYEYFLRGEIPQKTKQQTEQVIEDLRSSWNSSSSQWTDWNDFTNYNADEVND